MSSMGELTFFLGLQVKQKDDGIFISQDKYVADILKKFDFVTVKTASTPIETNKALLKDEEAEDVDVHLYRSMIGSLMYLTASRPDIMFVVCACARFQVTPKVSHLHAVKRIFRYLKGQPKLGLWYPRDSPFDLEAFSDSDYARASLDRKSTTGGCQFLGKRLISWQCKKQTIVANSTTKAEYVAAANCYGQVLWIQNQMLDYGFNFMNTKIHIDNESTICIVKNLVFHSKTKHIEIRHHFIKDSYEKRLIQVIKIHTDHNVADLLTKLTDQQNMVACLERIEGNADFYQIVDFLNASTISYSLTISPTIYASYIEQFWSTAKTKIVNNETQIHAKVDDKTIVISKSSVRRDDDIVVRATTTATSLEAEQESDTTLGDADAETRFETASKQSRDPPLSEVNTSGSGEDNMEHQDDLTDFIPPTPYDSPLSGGHTPRSDEGRPNINVKFTHGYLYKTCQTGLVPSKEKSLDKGESIQTRGEFKNKAQCLKEGDFDNDLMKLMIRTPPTTITTAFEDEDLTIAQTLVKIKVEDKEKKIKLLSELHQKRNCYTNKEILPTIDPKDKGKGIMQESEKPPKNPTKAQIQRDTEIAQRLFEEEQAQFEREMDANELLGEILQQEEREQFTIEEKFRMLVEMIAERKRFFAA
ncbi:hypothetical protein Tco_0718367 [Tanacetum coccineum]